MSAKKTGVFIVYKATAPSGKLYIGYSHFSLKDRIQMHLSEARNGTKRPFYNCLRKYKSQVKWEIVGSYSTEAYAKKRECYFIEKYKCTDRKYGYNCTKGGEGTPGLVRNSQRVKIIDKDGVIYNGFVDVCNKLELNKSTLYTAVTNNYWINGTYFSIYKEGMTAAVAPKTTHKRQRAVLNITTGETFSSIKEAAEFYKVAPQRLYDVLIGKRKKTRGQEFKYLHEGINT